MIKFFRKIRQQLITQNKFSKYLLYAIGEIVLVVIGILIALSINNWNESRKIKNIEQGLLKRLHSESTENKTRLEFIINRHQESVDHSNSLILMFSEDTDQMERSLIDSIFRRSIGSSFWTYNPRLGHLESAISSGQINYISNDELVAHLSEFTDHFDDVNEEILSSIDIWADQIAPLVFKYFEWSSPGKKEQYYFEFFGDIEVDSRFFRDNEVESWFRYRFSRQWSGLKEEKELLDQLNLIIDLISKEIVDE